MGEKTKQKDITVREKSTSTVFKSGYGMVTWREWLEKERDRFRANGRAVRIDENMSGKLALVDV